MNPGRIGALAALLCTLILHVAAYRAAPPVIVLHEHMTVTPNGTTDPAKPLVGDLRRVVEYI